MRKRPWINITLFALSERPLHCFVIAVLLASLWWYYTDFLLYVRESSAVRSETVFVTEIFVLSVTALVLMVWLPIRRALANYACKGDMGNPTDEQYRAMLSGVLACCGEGAKDYVRWLRDRASSASVYLRAALLPLFALFLAVPAMHSPLMEYIYSISHLAESATPGDAGKGDGFFRIESDAEQPCPDCKTKLIIRTPLTRDGGRFLRASNSMVATARQSSLKFQVGDFPHLHRSIEVLGCQGACNATGSTTVAVQGAKAVFAYTQPALTALLVTSLGIRVELRTCFGKSVSSVEID